MKRRILLLSAIFFVILVAAAFIGYRSYAKSFSPEAVADFDQNGLDVRDSIVDPPRKVA